MAPPVDAAGNPVAETEMAQMLRILLEKSDSDAADRREEAQLQAEANNLKFERLEEELR